MIKGLNAGAPRDKHSYSEWKVLLVLEVLVGGHKYVKLVGRATQQLAILQRGPAHLLDAANGMLG